MNRVSQFTQTQAACVSTFSASSESLENPLQSNLIANGIHVITDAVKRDLRVSHHSLSHMCTSLFVLNSRAIFRHQDLEMSQAHLSACFEGRRCCWRQCDSDWPYIHASRICICTENFSLLDVSEYRHSGKSPQRRSNKYLLSANVRKKNV